MNRLARTWTFGLRRASLVGGSLLALPVVTAAGQPASRGRPTARPQPLPIEYLQVQGLRRSVRFYRPEHLAERPSLVLVLHGSGGDGERFRRFTAASFDRLADQYGFVVAYPDALGGQWNDCRSGAPYHGALAGIDEVAFLRAVVRRAAQVAGQPLGDAFAVGYSNGGQLIFRLAFEAPREFAALAAIGAHLPVAEERDCRSTAVPVSILLVSGTDDPINPWRGGTVRLPGGGTPGRVLSAEATALLFARRAGAVDGPVIDRHLDRDPSDGARVETRRWVGTGGREVALMAVAGGGHTLPNPAAAFPAAIVGRTSRDLDGASEIWRFFLRHSKPR